MDFSNWKPRAHFMFEIMSEPKGKSKLEMYNEARQLYTAKLTEYNSLVDEGKEDGWKSNKIAEQLMNLEFKINDLKKVKDEPHVSSTCMKRLCAEYTRYSTGRERVINSKEIEKGLLLEEDAITEYSIHTQEFLVKNKQRKENEYVSGEIDIEEEERVTDTKVSWDIYSFDALMISGIKNAYEWQGRAYCWLWDKPMARIVHTLLNTPEHLIQNMERKLMYDMFGSEQRKNLASEEELEVYNEACKKIRFNHTYDDLPRSRKIRMFDIVRDKEIEQKMIDKIEQCRIILNNFSKLDYHESEEKQISG